MASRRKTALVLLAVLAALLLILLFVVPRLADLDRYRPEVIARLEQSTGRSVEIGRLSLNVLPALAVRADDIAVGNPPGFPQTSFLTVRRVYAELDAGALLHRAIVVRSLKLEAPSVNLVEDASGRWNTSSPAAPRVRPTAWQAAPATAVSITKVQLRNGHLTASHELASGGVEPPSFEADGVSVDLDEVNVEALGVHLAMGAPGAAGLTLRPAVLRAYGLGGGGEPGGALRLSGPAGGHGTFSATTVRFDAVHAGPLKSAIALYGDGVMLDGLTLEVSGGRATGDLVWDSATRPSRYGARLMLANIALGRLLEGVPSARGKITGTLEGRLNLTGSNVTSTDPLAGKDGAGNVTVRNGTLPTLQLNRNLMLLMKSVIKTGQESGDPSSFRSIAADLEIGGGEIRSRQITILGNGVDIDASGALGLVGAGRLDYTGVGKVSARNVGFTSLLAAALGSTMTADGKVNLPFTLTGTLDQPHFELKNSRLFH